MKGCGNLLLAVVLMFVATAAAGVGVGRVAPCCTRVSNAYFAEPITGYKFNQHTVLPCIKSMILHTKEDSFCVLHNAKWVREKIVAFRRANATPPPTVSLLSIITSTASSPSSSSSTLPPSSALPSSALPSSALPSSALPSIPSTTDETVTKGTSE